jgi:NAD(P)-dependent dehydrogenase (short-subunit alcohol dehydrogenase family)
VTTLADRTFVVTGGTRGLGREVIRRFVASGATAVLVARDPDRARAAADLIGPEEARHGRVEVERADLGDPASLESLAARLGHRPGGLAGLINNAAHILATRQVDLRGMERHLP